MKTTVIAIGAALCGSIFSMTLIGHAQPARTPSAVAYVSASRVLSESTAGRTEGARIQNMQQQRTGELRAKQQALETTRQQLATTADSAARTALQQTELQQRTDLEKATSQFQLDLQALQRELNADLMRRVKTALDDLMKTQNYQLILNSDTSVMWSTTELDLTAAVVGKMNAQ
jgi:Skp family chaperone for outer membrane proteins